MHFICSRAPKGSPVGPAGISREREGVGLKILSAGRDGTPVKLPQLPHCKNTLTLTSNTDCKACFCISIKSYIYSVRHPLIM